jgi:hypothetical protein
VENALAPSQRATCYTHSDPDAPRGISRQMRTLREAGQLLLASRLGGVLPGLARIRSIIVAVRKTSGAVTEPRHTAISGAPGLGWISVPGSGGGGLKRSAFVM